MQFHIYFKTRPHNDCNLYTSEGWACTTLSKEYIPRPYLWSYAPWSYNFNCIPPGAQPDIQFDLYIVASLRQAILMNFKIWFPWSVDEIFFNKDNYFIFLENALLYLYIYF